MKKEDPNNPWPRLAKLMSEQGLASRRKADELISQGLVKVNGKVITELGTRVPPDAKISISQNAGLDRFITIMLNKPIGFVSNLPEDGYEPAITLIKPENQSVSNLTLNRGHFKGLAVCGRLDIDSQGLLIFTQDGTLAKQLLTKGHIEKEYLVRFTGNLTDEKLSKLRHGLSLDDKALLPAKVERINSDQLKMILTEGKKRQIRRMLELTGLKVTGLKRVRIGKLVLGRLKEGHWQLLENPFEQILGIKK